MYVDEAIAEARRSVEGASLPADWQATAFEITLRHLLDSSRAVVSPDEAPRTPSQRRENHGQLGISDRALGDLVELDEEAGLARLTLPTSKVEPTKAAATRQLALLVLSLRVASGLDSDWVDSQHLRKALEDYNRYDSGNFSAYLKKLDEEVSAQKKDGKLFLKLRRAGWEAAANSWRSLAGDEA